MFFKFILVLLSNNVICAIKNPCFSTKTNDRLGTVLLHKQLHIIFSFCFNEYVDSTTNFVSISPFLKTGVLCINAHFIENKLTLINMTIDKNFSSWKIGRAHV